MELACPSYSVDEHELVNSVVTECPAVVIRKLGCISVSFLEIVQFAQLPRVAAIEKKLHASDTRDSARVWEALDGLQAGDGTQACTAIRHPWLVHVLHGVVQHAHSVANPARDDGAHREAMVPVQLSMVLFVRNENLAVRVEFDGYADRDDVSAARQALS
ncbi:hypothetical protein FGB62_12g439 [Gracilaria domingensis]|nr:hypothetical protein FGB62_12g439 [Gracilaria domingensis]